MKPVAVPISPALMWRLEVVAEQKGMTLPQYLLSSAVFASGLAVRPGSESIATLHASGLTVKQMAARLDMTNIAVKGQMKRLGLTANVAITQKSLKLIQQKQAAHRSQTLPAATHTAA